MHRKPSPLRTSLVFFPSVFLLLASPGFAQDGEADDSYGRPGWYLAVNGVAANILYRDTLGTTENTAGINARAGYRANPSAAIELEFEWLNPFDETLSGVTIAEYRTYALGLNGKYFLRDDAIQPYAILGVNVLALSKTTTLKKRDTDWGFRGGVGLDFYVAPKVALNVELTYMWGVGDVWERDYLAFGAGVMYRF